MRGKDEGGYALGVSQPVHGRAFCVLEKEALLCLFLDEFEVPGIALLPDRGGGGPVFDVARQPRLLAFYVQVVFRLVARCGAAGRGGSGRVRVGVQRRDAVQAESGDGAKEGVTPDRSAEALGRVLFVGSGGGGGRGGGAGTDGAGGVKRSCGSGSGSERRTSGGSASQHHVERGCGDHDGCDVGREAVVDVIKVGGAIQYQSVDLAPSRSPHSTRSAPRAIGSSSL